MWFADNCTFGMCTTGFVFAFANVWSKCFALLALAVSYLTLCAVFFGDRQRILRSSANLIPGVVWALAPLALIPVFS
jgi:hypothetical protein